VSLDHERLSLHLKQGDHMLSIRANGAEEFQLLIQAAEKLPELGVFFGGGPTSPVAGTVSGRPPAPVSAAGSTTSTDGATSTWKPVSDEEASAALQRHLGAGEELASENLIKAASKKSGMTVESLAGISKNRAINLINGKG